MIITQKFSKYLFSFWNPFSLSCFAINLTYEDFINCTHSKFKKKNQKPSDKEDSNLITLLSLF